MIFSFNKWDRSRRSLRFLAILSGSFAELWSLCLIGQWPLVKGFSYWATLSSQALGLTKKYQKYQIEFFHQIFPIVEFQVWYFWYFLVKPSACELRVAQYEKPLTKGHCPIKQRDQNSAKDPDKIAKKRSERCEHSHLLNFDPFVWSGSGLWSKAFRTEQLSAHRHLV